MVPDAQAPLLHAPRGPRAGHSGRSASGPALELRVALALVFTTIGFEQLVHTDGRALASLPLYHALHWLSDSLLALPLGAAAVWGGVRLAGWTGVGEKTLPDTAARAWLIALLFALLLVPGAALHGHADRLTHTHALLSIHSHVPVQARGQPEVPAAVAGFLGHALADGLAGQVIGVPLLILLLWWQAHPTRAKRAEASWAWGGRQWIHVRPASTADGARALGPTTGIARRLDDLQPWRRTQTRTREKEIR